MQVRLYDRLDDLPGGYAALFERAGRRELCLTRPWFECLAANTLAEGERLRLVGVEGGIDRTPLALLVARHRERDPEAGAARTLTSLSTYYTMVFEPHLSDGTGAPEALATLFRELRARDRPYHMMRFQPLERDAPGFAALGRALRAAGLVVQPYFHFGNWYEATEGVSLEEFLARRPSALRSLLKRRARRLETSGRVRVNIITDGIGLERGARDYERVYGRSWKGREPYARFIRELMGVCARQGALRLGLLYLEDEPIAAQLWTVWNRRATIYKLAHDARFDRLSPGSLLTLRMMERVLEVDRVVEVDFGAGDDPFKRSWLSRRRERWGIAAFDPRTARGAAGALRHVAGGGLKRALSRGTSRGLP
jgi:CelD/BcsL family acetyltransferase involved in cellulose biosynthesis